MKKILIILSVIALVLIGGYYALRATMGQDMPSGKEGPAADALAQRMMSACGAEAWKDTRYVKWTFADRNQYLWDRTRSRVRVTNDDGDFVLNSSSGEGIARWSSEDPSPLPITEEETAAAWSNFCNDSFWLIAPLKVMDPGTRRELVSSEEGDQLMVSYTSGGVTPGDSYLWQISDDGLPYACRMWTQILPIPGIKATWTGWQTLHTGVKVATAHKIGTMDLIMSDVQSGSTLQELGITKDPFDE